MRSTGPFSQLNRYVARHGLRGKPIKDEFDRIVEGEGLGSKSLLAGMAAFEAPFLKTMATLAGVVEPEYLGWHKKMPNEYV